MEIEFYLYSLISSHCSRAILDFDIYYDRCVATLIEISIRKVEFTVRSSTLFGSRLYERHVVDSALEILGIVADNLPMFLNYA